MSNEPDHSPPPEAAPSMEVRLLVWIEPAHAWRARAIGPGDVAHDFASPFELARFMAWPFSAGSGPAREGLR